MKKTLLLFLLSAAALTFAQTPITYSDVENIFASGKAWLSASNDNPQVTMDVGSASSTAQNWTVPNIAWQDTFIAVNTSPASTPYSSEFPTATHAQQTNGSLYGYSGTLYSYYQLDNTALYSLGTVADVKIGSVDTVLISKNESDLFSLPLTYGTTNELSSDTTNVAGGIIYVNSSSHTVDGFGNITFPFGTFPALRVLEITETRAYLNGTLLYKESQKSLTWIAKDAAIFQADIDTSSGTSGTVSLIGAELTQFITAPLAVNDKGTNGPNNFVLYQNYPNPFNPTTKIRYTIPAPTSNRVNTLVTLKVYNVLGNEVATLVNEEKPAGTYEAEFSSKSDNGVNLPSGVYFYRLTAGSFIKTQKMLLLK